MTSTDTSEKGLESLIVAALTGAGDTRDGAVGETRPALAGYVLGDPAEYDREHAVDLGRLLAFLNATQPHIVAQFALESDGPKRRQFLNRLQGEIAKRGVIDLLRKGLSHGPAHVDLFYGAPTPGNRAAERRYAENVFSLTRQLQYSPDATRLALDLGLFINGLPVFTFELKNRLTRQSVLDAVEQYKRDRDPRDLLFQFKRCAAHFAVDDQEVRFCTELKGKASWFLPFNQGHDDGAGNPPNPDGLKTAYLWERILTRDSLSDIIENYAQVVAEKDDRTGKKREKQIFPRYHQLDVVRALLADARASGAGRRYLIQHSAGSGKSNSIAWLAHQLVGLEQASRPIFDSVVVVTDRRVLDKQIRNTIKQFAQVSAVVGHAERSGDLRRFITEGKKIIITTVQKFPFVVDEIGNDHRGRTFAILIDEAHSSQSGRTAGTMNEVLSGESDYEDEINHIMESRKLLPNASYFAFTATPKNKTLEIFGTPFDAGGVTRRRPFHSYTMKQAVQEGFILDVLQQYTPVSSYYRLMKTVEDDPEYDVKRAQKKLRRYVEGHDHAIGRKAEIMVDHFHDQVIARGKINGQARAMVATSGIQRAIDYYHAIRAYLEERQSPWQAIVAFSGEHDYGGVKVTEASLNGFPSSQIEERFREDPYRFLVVADKFQTGYDEPLLHTMYVDKILSGIKAVQTLSRLNRAHPGKHDTFVLDFANDADIIRASFEPYYRTTILSEETDPNKLHDLKSDLDGYQVYTPEQVAGLVDLYLSGAERDRLDPILDTCAALYNDLDEDGQVDFKSKAKAFVRTYNFLAAILPYSSVDWERLSTFLNFLIPKLPAPREEDLSKGILEAIDMDSYRAEVRAALSIALADQDGEIGAVPVEGGGYVVEPELDRLSNIVKQFNELWGDKTKWRDVDKIHRVISEEVPERVAADRAYQNAMKYSDEQNARIELNSALQRVMDAIVYDHIDLYKLYADDPSFKHWLRDQIFATTYSTA